MFIQCIFYGLASGSIYALVALGLVLIYKCSGILNLALGGMILVAPFSFTSLVNIEGMPILLALSLSIAISFIIGSLLMFVFMRPLFSQPIVSAIMMTVALFVLLDSVSEIIWGPDINVVPVILPKGELYLGKAVISYEYISAFIIALSTCFMLVIYFQKSRTGIKLRAICDDQQCAQSLGININRALILTWGIVGVIAAIAGIIIGSLSGVKVAITSSIGLKVLSVIMVGGVESIPGAIIGGFIFGIAENFSVLYLDPLVGGGMMEVLPYALIMLILMIRPEGLFGLERIERI